MAKPVEVQLRAEAVQEGTALQESALEQVQGNLVRGETTSRFKPMYSTFEEFLVHTHTNSSPLKFRKSPRAKFRLTSKKGIGLSFGLALEISPAQTGTKGKGASVEPI